MENKNERPADNHETDHTVKHHNSEKESAAEVNRAGDEKSRNYMNKPGKESHGPHYNKESKNADGDTTVNAGIFK